jgi:hypothetical protein
MLSWEPGSATNTFLGVIPHRGNRRVRLLPKVSVRGRHHDRIARNRISPLCVFGAMLLCSLFALGFAPSASADAIYTYTGQPFTNFSGGDSRTNGVGECSLFGTVTFFSPLPPNSTFSVSGVIFDLCQVR